MVGAYVGYFALTSLNVPFFPAFLLCGLGSGLLAVIIERLVYSPLRKRHAPSLYFIISAMGASIFLENFVIATIDGTPRNYPPIFNNRISIGGISLGVDSLLMIVVSSVALLIGFPATPIFSSCRSWKWATWRSRGCCTSSRAVRWPGSSSGQPRPWS